MRETHAAGNRSLLRAAQAVAMAVGLSVNSLGGTAAADPIPGFTFDAEELRERMDDCLSYKVDEDFLLMGWVKATTGERRQWRCSSLRHMYFTTTRGNIHDPYIDIAGFLRCTDRVVSYGFPRRGSPGNTVLIMQYHGTKRRAEVVVNDATGDIATIYTVNSENDWTECATWRP